MGEKQGILLGFLDFLLGFLSFLSLHGNQADGGKFNHLNLCFYPMFGGF